MVEQNKVSIIIPVYNVEEYLNKCLESVVSQTYKNLEIILVDDGSPDSCPAMCDEWSKRDRRIKVIHQKNGGAAAARNTGLAAASGDFVAFVDSDDWICQDFYQKLFEKQKEHNFDVVFCRCNYVIDGKPFGLYEKSLSEFCATKDMKYLLAKDDLVFENGKYQLEKSVQCFSIRAIYRTECIKHIQFPLGVKIAEDQVFFVKLFANQNLSVGLVDEYLYYYLQRQNSALHTKQANGLEDTMLYLEQMKLALQNTKYEKYYPALQFFSFAERAIDKYVKHAEINLKEISNWNTKQNYKIAKLLMHGKKQKIKYLTIRLKLYGLLKLLYKYKTNKSV